MKRGCAGVVFAQTSHRRSPGPLLTHSIDGEVEEGGAGSAEEVLIVKRGAELEGVLTLLLLLSSRSRRKPKEKEIGIIWQQMTQFAEYKGRQPPGSRYNAEIKKRRRGKETRKASKTAREREREREREKRQKRQKRLQREREREREERKRRGVYLFFSASRKETASHPLAKRKRRRKRRGRGRRRRKEKKNKEREERERGEEDGDAGVWRADVEEVRLQEVKLEKTRRTTRRQKISVVCAVFGSAYFDSTTKKWQRTKKKRRRRPEKERETRGRERGRPG